jgi:hypothetical protein
VVLRATELCEIFGGGGGGGLRKVAGRAIKGERVWNRVHCPTANMSLVLFVCTYRDTTDKANGQ